MSSIEYNEETIESLLDIIGHARSGLQSQLNELAKRDADTNYLYYTKRLNSFVYKLLKFFKSPLNYKKEVPISYIEFATNMYESSIKYYSQGRLERIDDINEMALEAMLNKNKFYFSTDDHRFIMQFINL